MSGSLLMVSGRNLQTKHFPLNIRAKFLAANRLTTRTCFALNRGAVLSGYAIECPLLYRLVPAMGDMQRDGRMCWTAENLDCSFDSSLLGELDGGFSFHSPNPILDTLALQDNLAFSSAGPAMKLPSMSIHEAIKAYRLALDWSHERLADEVSKRENLSKPLAWQTVQQWENGKSAPMRKRLPFVAQALGITLEELNARANGQDVPTKPAHLLSLTDLKLSSPVIAWGVLNMKTLPEAFKVAAPDDSMSPRLKIGQLAEFETGLEHRPGDGVLVRDSAGECYIRRCRKVRGEWEAYAEDSAVHLPIAILSGHAEIIAVLVGVHARWG